jgi:hypothetical protein
MKILFIYRFLSLGGVETVLKNRQEGFRALGIHTDYIFLEDPSGYIQITFFWKTTAALPLFRN